MKQVQFVITGSFAALEPRVYPGVSIFHNDMAIVMRNYDFTDSKGKVTRVEYTFTYVKTNKGALKIVLQHSSLPFSG